MTVCGSGRSDNYLAIGFYELFLEFLRRKNLSIPFNGYNLVFDLKVTRWMAGHWTG